MKTKLPKKDVESMGNKKLPQKPLKGPDKCGKPKFKTGKSG